MAKRFTDTLKWDDDWYMNLPPEFKLLYQYILDKCDAVGVWKPNFRLAEFHVGQSLDFNQFKDTMNERLQVTAKGYWWLTKFVEFQYGRLNPNSRPHLSYIQLLQKHGVGIDYLKGMDTLKEKAKEKDKEKEKDKQVIVKGKCLMKNSGVTLQEVHVAFLATTDLRSADSKFYYDTALDWSNNGNLRSDWIGTIRNFARRDLKDGKMKISVHKPSGGTNLGSTPVTSTPFTGKEITREEYLKQKKAKKDENDN